MITLIDKGGKMLYILELLVVFCAILLIAGMIWLTRKLVPEFDAWWKKANTHDPEIAKLEALKREEARAAKKAQMASGLSKKEYDRRVKYIQQTFKERGSR